VVAIEDPAQSRANAVWGESGGIVLNWKELTFQTFHHVEILLPHPRGESRTDVPGRPSSPHRREHFLHEMRGVVGLALGTVMMR